MALPLQFAEQSTVSLVTADVVRRPLFDDAELFALLRDHLLPQAIARNAATRTLAIWSVGCADGAELYSIAMLIDTHFPELNDWLVTLYGSDESGTAVALARSGRVRTDAGPTEVETARYLDRATGQVTRTLRMRCFFEELDLAAAWPALPVFDVVVVRDVLLDLAPAVREDVLTGFQSRLAVGGHVVLGADESRLRPVDGYRRERYGDTNAFRFSA